MLPFPDLCVSRQVLRLLGFYNPCRLSTELVAFVSEMLSGFSIFHSYLMKSGDERQAPLCNSCRVGLTIEHILTACPAFDSERRAASLHGRSMSEVLGNDCRIGGLMLFLRNTGFYHKF